MDEPVVEVTARLVKGASPGSIRIQVRPPPDASVAASSSSSLVSHGRELLSGLLCKHASKLSELRQQVNECEHFNAKLHDDIWLLRFLLSHLPKKAGDVAAAATAAKETMAWRHANGMDNPSLPCGGPKSLTVPAIAKIYAALRDPAALSYYVPDPNRGTVLVAVPALIDFHAAAATMTDDESALAHRLSTEWLFRQCDAVTRRTGYLTKTIRLIDLKGIKLSGMNREFQRRDARNSKTLEDFYPQLLGAVYLCHAPGWMQMFWRGLRSVLPARVVEKVDFLEPKQSIRERERLLQWIAAEHLPECFGGPCKAWPPPNSRFLLPAVSSAPAK